MNRTKQKKLVTVKGLVTAAVILVFIVCFSIYFGNADERKLNELLNLGNRYLDDMDYENAVLTFDQAIAIDPKCEKAYLGKALAQYEMGQYEEAIKTAEEGISKVDDSSELETFLQGLLSMIGGEVNESVDDMQSEIEAKTLRLNYSWIVRFVDTKESEIQIEVLGDEGNGENYSWVSSNPECVSVSKTGKVTCLPVEGVASIYAENDFGKSNECVVRICSSGEENESEGLRVRVDEAKQDYAVSIEKTEGGESAEINVLEKNVYYSGDIVIPDRLKVGEKEVTVTGISSRAFRWSDKLESVYIPSTISSVGVEEHIMDNPFYFCTSLENINVDERNKYLKEVDGVLYSKDGTILYSYPAGKNNDSYTIPKEVKKICSGTFAGCKNLKEILVEEGNPYYESIDGAVIEKEKNRLVAYPVGRELISYKVPDTVRYLSPNVFYDSNLEDIDCSSVEEIYDEVFRGCNALKVIKGGENTTYISWMSDMMVEFTGFNSMKKLNILNIKPTVTQNFNEFAELESLMTLRIDAAGQELDLKGIGETPALSSLEIENADNIEDLSWIARINSLSGLRLRTKKYFKTEEVLKGLQNMENLRTLQISKIEKLSDLSWIKQMKSLQELDITAIEFSVTDLSPLLSLGNINYVDISSYSATPKELGETVKQQIEEIKIQKPEAQISIWE